MQIKMFVIKPTDHNGFFFAAVLLVLAATESGYLVLQFLKFKSQCFFFRPL